MIQQKLKFLAKANLFSYIQAYGNEHSIQSTKESNYGQKI